MNTNAPVTGHDLGKLADEARAFMTATADVAGDKVAEARKRLDAALDAGREIYGRVRTKAVEGAHAADEAVTENPYTAVAVGVGLGALLGYMIARNCCCRRD